MIDLGRRRDEGGKQEGPRVGNGVDGGLHGAYESGLLVLESPRGRAHRGQLRNLDV